MHRAVEGPAAPEEDPCQKSTEHSCLSNLLQIQQLNPQLMRGTHRIHVLKKNSAAEGSRVRIVFLGLCRRAQAMMRRDVLEAWGLPDL